MINLILKRIKEDIMSVKERDPAARSFMEIFLLYPGIHAVISYRIAHWFHIRKHYFIARWISQRARKKTGIEIHPGATIGHGLFIDHGMGVVIGETAEVGNNCTIYQGVTLGGTGKDKGKRHPTIGDNVMIGAGAKILGPFSVGSNCKIAANTVVLKEIPPNCTAVGSPARIAIRDGVKIPRVVDLDQIHFSDPYSNELISLNDRLKRLEDKTL